jgi:hypothetical protein
MELLTLLVLAGGFLTDFTIDGSDLLPTPNV